MLFTKKIIIRISTVLIPMILLCLTIGQILPIELAEYKHRELIYFLALPGLPIAIMLTLLRTIKRENTKTQNLINAGYTILISSVAFMMAVGLFFASGPGDWRTVSIIYRHKEGNTEIREQWLSTGALGYGDKRIVLIKPVMKYWNYVSIVDTTTLDKSEWHLVDEPGDIEY